MTEIRGEAVHVCAWKILKYEKVKKLKTTIKLSKLIKTNDYRVLSLYISRKCSEKELKKFSFNNVNMNKILCHGCNEDNKTGTLEIIHDC